MVKYANKHQTNKISKQHKVKSCLIYSQNYRRINAKLSGHTRLLLHQQSLLIDEVDFQFAAWNAQGGFDRCSAAPLKRFLQPHFF